MLRVTTQRLLYSSLWSLVMTHFSLRGYNIPLQKNYIRAPEQHLNNTGCETSACSSEGRNAHPSDNVQPEV